MKKIKVVIKEIAKGTKYTVYKKFLGIWCYAYGYEPLDSCFFLFDEDIKRLKSVYGDKLLINDCGTRAGKPVITNY